MPDFSEVLKIAVEQQDWQLICGLYTNITGEPLSVPSSTVKEEEKEEDDVLSKEYSIEELKYQNQLSPQEQDLELIDKDIDNMSFIAVDLYHPNFDIISETKVEQSVDFILIDAGHSSPEVESDLINALKLKPKYIAFDDYGLINNIMNTVNNYVKKNRLKIVKGIGAHNTMEVATNRKNDTETRKLNGFEGVICEVIYD